MKSLFISTVLLLAPLAAHAECDIKDFAITDFKPEAGAGRLILRGQLTNNCASASAAQIRIEIKDDTGSVLQSRKIWPAGTSNITPGHTVEFDLGRMFRAQTGIATFTASIVDVRTW